MSVANGSSDERQKEAIPLERKLATDKQFAYNTLVPVFQYLELEDLTRAAHVCKLWHWIITYDENLMFSKIFASCEAHLSELTEKFGPKIKSLEIDGVSKAPTRSITGALRKMPNLKRITLADCCLPKLDQILDALNPNIEAIHIEQTHKEYCSPYSFEFVKKFSNLTYLGVMTFSNIVPESLEALKHLQKLAHLFVYDGCKSFKFEILKDLQTLKSLRVGGETSNFLNRGPDYMESILKDNVNLRKIKLDVYQGCNYTFFRGLNFIPNLTELELNGEIVSKPTGNKFINSLTQCTKIKILTIEMDPEFTPNSIYDHAVRNSILHKAVLKLKNSLTHLYWLIPVYYVKWARDIWGKDNGMLFQRFQKRLPKTDKDVKVIHIKEFEQKLSKQMPNTKVFVLVQNYTYRYCSECIAYKPKKVKAQN